MFLEISGSENGMVVADALERVHSILDMKPLPDAVKNEKPKDKRWKTSCFPTGTLKQSGNCADIFGGRTVRR